MRPRIIETVAEMQAASMEAKRSGKKVAFVPTMGYLHEGHLALVRKAREFGETVAASIFVNPTQFGPNEDLSRYPRDFEGDIQKLESVKTDIVFFPSAKEMYQEGSQTFLEVEKVSKGLCGEFRPAHFRGVATVVAKVFNCVLPDAAVFGEKDFQQLKVIERMTVDMNFPVKIVPLPTVREPDGLAMSSRNVYLSQEERKQALSLSRALFAAQKQADGGERKASVLIERAREEITKNPLLKIQYLEVRDASTLEPVADINREARMLLAVFAGKTRLIDNVRLNPQLNRKG